MNAFHDVARRLRAALLCTGIIMVGAGAAAPMDEPGTQPMPPGKARMNIVFLDDAAERLPAGAPVRYNHWPEWDTRVPRFQTLLREFIADFRKAQTEQPAPDASLYAIEVSATAIAANRDGDIAKYLAAISEATNRPTLVLARSTAGTDQLRLVFVFKNDCPPREAAGFLAALTEAAPPVFHGRIGERFGPFRAPPTVVFDPRADALAPVQANQKAQHRWGILEEDAYLLPHYVLHAVAVLHEAPLTREAGWLANRTVEPGNATVFLGANAADTERLARAMTGREGLTVLSLEGFRNSSRLGTFDSNNHVVRLDSASELRQLMDSGRRLNIVAIEKGAYQLLVEEPRLQGSPLRQSSLASILPPEKVSSLKIIGPGEGNNAANWFGFGNDTARNLRKLADSGVEVGVWAAHSRGPQNWLLNDFSKFNIPVVEIGTRQDQRSGSAGIPWFSAGGDAFFNRSVVDLLRRDGEVNLTGDRFQSWDRTTQSFRNQGAQSLAGIFGGFDKSDGLNRLESRLGPNTGPSSNLRDISLRLTPQDLHLFHAREQTFSGSGTKPSDVLGGVLFEHDNHYLVDLSGRTTKEVTEEARTRKRTKGIVTGTLHYFDDLPLVWLDVVAPRNGSLPVALPRFLDARTDAGSSFSGVWSFEPLTVEVRQSAENRLQRATVTTLETRTPVSYMPLDLVLKGEPPLLTIRNGTGFEPHLEAKKDGGYVWTLRHGVTIEFNADGLVEAIRSPHGEHVVYHRETGQLVGQETSDGRRIDIQYANDQPRAFTLDRKPRAAYQYHADYWLVEARGDRETWSIGYDQSGRPARVASATTTLSFTHDEQGRLTSVASGATAVRIEYLEGTNTLRLSGSEHPTTEWLLGPISGPVMEDRAVLLTRNIASRILQVSKGTVQGTGYTRQFTPTETIALVR